ncbi:hypothetical protein IW261DRAFT_1502881 [Armillaria novae-zelandiae]|uniref:Uncharacterized protein n=1 Tax=Armillaria novae-zelandiae TaxID=153914 RepID=A0AA39NXG6_9AGAR|nr:hypothetical protein IW261DRAFT_1502881 [Armillaria novae-zelandiae]
MLATERMSFAFALGKGWHWWSMLTLLLHRITMHTNVWLRYAYKLLPLDIYRKNILLEWRGAFLFLLSRRISRVPKR